MTGLLRADTRADLLTATHGDPFLRYDLPDPLEHPAYVLGHAVTTLRRTHTGRVGLLVMGPPDDAGELVGTVLEAGLVPPHLARVTVSRGSFEAVAAHLPLGASTEWEWMYAVSAPPVVAAEARLVRLGRSDSADIDAFLAEHNPRSDARAVGSPGQHWVGVRDDAGALVACGVREPGISGYPVLAGITVHPSYRGSGLGLAVTAYLTRAAIAERGVSVLGMYSDNDRARRVYHRLGYGGDHPWSSASLCRAPSGRRHGASRAPA